MKKHTRALTAFSVRFGILFFGLWFLCMSLLTLGTAQYIFRDLCIDGLRYAETALMLGHLDDWFSSDDEYAQGQRNMPGAVEFHMNGAIARAGQSVGPPELDGYPSMENTFRVFRDTFFTCDTAMVFLDKDGNLLRESGDFIYFEYIPQKEWQTGTDETSACGWIDISDVSDSRYSVFRTIYAGTTDLYDLMYIRMTGYMDGSRIEPVSMAFLTEGAYHDVLDRVSPRWSAVTKPIESKRTVSEDGTMETLFEDYGTVTLPYSVSELDAMGLLEWDVRFDDTARIGTEHHLVTIYAKWPEITLYEPDGPVRYQTAEKYENLLALLKTKGCYRDKGRNTFFFDASQFDLWNLIMFSSSCIYDLRDYDPSGGEPFPDAEYYIMTAIQASPLKIAIILLRNMYIITFAVALIGFLYIRSSVRRYLVMPLQSINEGMAADCAHVLVMNEKVLKWQEPYELWKHYHQTQDILRSNKSELIRLNTALKYAKTAEENRRQMTSNIAHELKTPLAVIHSYAEGLKEHIAEEKRDKYVDVILSEVERMDSMVLEMLDLSRLEAGKVKLSRNEFSLADLTKSIIEKLEMAAQAKELHIEFAFMDDAMVTADEGRIAQVIENFATNAVEYTPVCGHILIKIQAERSGMTFSIENDSEPLSDEALRKVWDTFYRADEARSGGGTGLGLAIAKNIVELHGGTCLVQNTKTGVEFRFTIYTAHRLNLQYDPTADRQPGTFPVASL